MYLVSTVFFFSCWKNFFLFMKSKLKIIFTLLIFFLINEGGVYLRKILIEMKFWRFILAHKKWK